MNKKLECIPVRCVLPALYRTGGRSLSRGVSVQGESLFRVGSLSRGVFVQRGSLFGGGLCPKESLCPGGSLSRWGSLSGGFSVGGFSVRETPSSVDRQTPVKILPCPKLR